jgi:phage FluMu protein Com
MEELDGNAAAGALAEVFVPDVTAARGRCHTCGNIAAVAEACVYVEAPGLVIRCRACDNVLLVLVRTGQSHVLALHGMSWLELRAT